MTTLTTARLHLLFRIAAYEATVSRLVTLRLCFAFRLPLYSHSFALPADFFENPEKRIEVSSLDGLEDSDSVWGQARL